MVDMFLEIHIWFFKKIFKTIVCDIIIQLYEKFFSMSIR